jgi:hypothetical protein
MDPHKADLSPTPASASVPARYKVAMLYYWCDSGVDMTALHWRRAFRETLGSLAHKGAPQ